MLTISHDIRGHAGHLQWQPTQAMRLAALLATLIVMSVAVNALTNHADSNPRQQSSAAGDCSAIAEKVERLACFDNLARQPAPHPARGANAPEHSHSH
jgi:hypothetical protein